MREVKDLKLNIGCGNSPTPEDWVNIDSSFNAKLATRPKLRKFLYRIGIIPKRLYELPWPTNITIIDVRKPLPFRDDSVKYIYTSHLLEHLYKEDAENLLKECYRILQIGGVIRIIVPDLLSKVSEYNKRTEEIANYKGLQEYTPPADMFLEGLGMFEKAGEYVPFWIRLIRKIQSDKNIHKWMYDLNSLSRRLEKIGFADIRRKEYGESLIVDVRLLDNRDRFERCICVEASKK
jgi:predicted SAM-dependent methyltransferase